jgi:hypothetical protein
MRLSWCTADAPRPCLNAPLPSHRKGVANRDIKLDNLLLHPTPGLPQPLLRVCDFGCSRSDVARRRGAPAHSRVGTLYYVAPEVRGPRCGCGTVAPAREAASAWLRRGESRGGLPSGAPAPGRVPTPLSPLLPPRCSTITAWATTPARLTWWVPPRGRAAG